MGLINKNIISKLLFNVLLLCCFSCSKEKFGCFSVLDLNYPVKTPIRGPVLFKIPEEKISKEIIGKNIAGDFYESNIKNLFIVMNQDTLDSFSKVKLKKKANIIALRLPTGRYRWEFKDSISAMKQIKKEQLVLELYNGEIIKLKYCDD